MMHRLIKHKRLIILLAIAITVNGYWLIDLRKKDQAQAQACITILPTIRYGVASGSGTAVCFNQLVNVVAPGVGNPWVGLTGWRLDFSCGSCDHETHDIVASISGVGYDNNSVNFTVTACLNGDGATYGANWWVRYVVVRWR